MHVTSYYKYRLAAIPGGTAHMTQRGHAQKGKGARLEGANIYKIKIIVEVGRSYSAKVCIASVKVI